MNLTKRTIQAIKNPASGRDTYRDDTDTYLHLIVTPTAKVWRYIRKVNGQVVFITLGRYPDMTPDQARQASRKTSAEYSMGKDPREARRQARKVTTWADLFTWYMEEHAKPHKRTWQADEDMEALYCTAWRNRAWSTITKAVISTWHKGIGKHRGKHAADRVLSLVKTVFNKAIAGNVISGENPAEYTERFYKTAKKYSRSRFLRGEEIKRLFEALDGYHDQDMAEFFKLCIFTGARRGNVQSMRWADFNRGAAVWTIPAADSKNQEALEISVLLPAAEILNRRWENRKSDVWVFPSRRAKAKTPHLSEPKKAWAAICKTAKLEDVRIHDLRRTLGSWMAIGGASLPIIGKALGHRDQRATEIYARLDADPVRAAMGGAVTKMLEAVNGPSKKAKVAQ